LEKQISLEEVSTLTRIGLPSLLTIEQEDIERLPDEVFAKGFIRSFAWAIGADGDDAVRRYELYLDAARKIPGSEDLLGTTARQRLRKLSASVVLLTGILALSIFGRAHFQNQSASGTPGEQTIAAEIAQSADSQQYQPVGIETQTARSDAETIVLKVTALKDTWLKVLIDAKASANYTLTSGDELELEAVDGYNLLIGDARGVTLVLNDTLVPVPGNSGEVVTINLP